MPALVLCGAISGAFTSLTLTPIELVKCQMQVPARVDPITRKSPGLFTIISSIYRQYGLLGFWYGQLGTLVRETGGSAAWFGSYEAVLLSFKMFTGDTASFRSTAEKSSPPVYQQLLAGAIAGMNYNFIFFPADTIKSRMQTEQLGSEQRTRKTFSGVARLLWQQQGVIGFYRGCGLTVARSAPSSALIFTVYESLKSRFA